MVRESSYVLSIVVSLFFVFVFFALVHVRTGAKQQHTVDMGIAISGFYSDLLRSQYDYFHHHTYQ